MALRKCQLTLLWTLNDIFVPPKTIETNKSSSYESTTWCFATELSSFHCNELRKPQAILGLRNRYSPKRTVGCPWTPYRGLTKPTGHNNSFEAFAKVFISYRSRKCIFSAKRNPLLFCTFQYGSYITLVVFRSSFISACQLKSAYSQHGTERNFSEVSHFCTGCAQWGKASDKAA